MVSHAPSPKICNGLCTDASVKGEEDNGERMERLAVQLAGLADVYVNDAFGSWQPHTSTFHVTKYLPSFAGLCMQVICSAQDISPKVHQV